MASKDGYGVRYEKQEDDMDYDLDGSCICTCHCSAFQSLFVACAEFCDTTLFTS